MKTKYKVSLVFIALVVSFIIYETYRYYEYRNIEVVNYKTLMLKAEYGNVTKSEIRHAAEHFMKNYICTRSADENHNKECLQDFVTYKDACAKKHIEDVDINDMNEHIAHNIVRIYKVCIEGKNMF